ncbi:transcription factor [Pyrofollis japonicus]|uniref:GntR family transcriptional regulator n=1 Tax=Pyrofollis japonicus TaxID=3060460 RepID=UPI00295B253A|nr:GntR family transcriptional regulator [Pyrofollis japonicus]BEP17116.1 transcription factor [Pyrofollis japonicus]
MGTEEAEKLYKFVEKLLDANARQVFQVLFEEGEELTEVDIAEKTGLKLNAIRRALNMLAEQGLVVYRRQKHPEKNRLIFYWKVNYEALPAIIEARKKATLEKLKTLLSKEESTMYYVCPNDGTRYTFEEALEHEFVCPRCGTMLVPDKDRELRIQILSQYISMLEAEINEDTKSR